MAAQKELSLKKLYNDLNEMKESLQEKVDYIYDLFVNDSVFPVDITIEEDSPGLWPHNGIMLYSIIPSQNMSEMFCTRGTIFHFAAGDMAFQIMNVVEDINDRSKQGRLYIRTGSFDRNSWENWELINTSRNTFQSLVYKGYVKRKAQEVIPNVNPRTNYLEIALSIAANYSTLARGEILKGTNRINQLTENLSDYTHIFPSNLSTVREGDGIVYGNGEYISIYDGAGGCFGSSLTPGEVIHYDSCFEIGENLTPTKVIKF